ncbi:hypothetical protein ABEB36_002978 [Hypothenemus hampei]|uniref:Uncharacterized protein n=1 Tax=Hypothenemus hampei TaxID=57062 RepID=A0ABD1F7Z6_HYPHA
MPPIIDEITNNGSQAIRPTYHPPCGPPHDSCRFHRPPYQNCNNSFHVWISVGVVLGATLCVIAILCFFCRHDSSRNPNRLITNIKMQNMSTDSNMRSELKEET